MFVPLQNLRGIILEDLRIFLSIRKAEKELSKVKEVK
jgi:hypothetical protein